MSRGVFAVMAGLLCAMAGLRRASALKGDAARLSRWVQLLRHLALLLRQGTLSIPQALVAAAEGTQAPDNLLREMAAKLQAAPMLTLSEVFLQRSEAWQEKAALGRLFSGLGHGTLESRCLAAEQAAEELQLMAASAAARAEKDAKLWQTLGFIGGTCLTIMLL